MNISMSNIMVPGSDPVTKYFVINEGDNESIEVDSIPDEVFENAYFYNYIDGEFIFNEELKIRITRENEIHDRIAELKNNLASTDYVIIKIAEGCATTEEYANVIGFRSDWRTEINNLETELEELTGDTINE